MRYKKASPKRLAFFFFTVNVRSHGAWWQTNARLHILFRHDYSASIVLLPLKGGDLA
jgi:hypothetical protein